MTFLRTAIPLYPFDLSMIYFGKPVSTFPDHARGGLPVALMPVADALAAILAGAEPLPEEMVALDDAFHRVLARDVAARRTQPPQAMSAMDGYAVRAADAAKIDSRLTVTGDVVPEGADAVVIQEDTVADGKRITIKEAAITGRHIRPAGIDFREGDVL